MSKKQERLCSELSIRKDDLEIFPAQLAIFDTIKAWRKSIYQVNKWSNLNPSLAATLKVLVEFQNRKCWTTFHYQFQVKMSITRPKILNPLIERVLAVVQRNVMYIYCIHNTHLVQTIRKNTQTVTILIKFDLGLDSGTYNFRPRDILFDIHKVYKKPF